MRFAAFKELTGEGVLQPSLKAILKYQGGRIIPAVESTPREITTIYASTFEDSCEIEKFKIQPSPDTFTREQHALLQTSLEHRRPHGRAQQTGRSHSTV